MREIFFRGKDVDRKEWIYGGYSLYPHTRFPCTPTIYEVDSGCWHPVEVIEETVGQYSGRDDKNGQKIFEGDIIKAVLPDSTSRSGFIWPLMKVAFMESAFFMVDSSNWVFAALGAFAPSVTLEVVGNIHDNPELLKGKKESE